MSQFEILNVIKGLDHIEAIELLIDCQCTHPNHSVHSTHVSSSMPLSSGCWTLDTACEFSVCQGFVVRLHYASPDVEVCFCGTAVPSTSPLGTSTLIRDSNVRMPSPFVYAVIRYIALI